MPHHFEVPINLLNDEVNALLERLEDDALPVEEYDAVLQSMIQCRAARDLLAMS